MENPDLWCGKTSPRAFSSNKGADFAAVLTETVRIAEPKAPAVPIPKKGWPTAGCLTGDGVGGKWSVAWRVFDAQFWGVPQRRRRIALVADFGGTAAPEILFERESLCGYPPPRGSSWQAAPCAVKGGVGESISSRGAFYGSKTETLRAESHGDLPIAYCIQGNCIDRADTAGCNGKGWTENVSYTLNTFDRPAVYGFKSRAGSRAQGICYAGEKSPTLSAACHNASVFLALENHPQDGRLSKHGNLKIPDDNVVQTLNGQMGTGGNNTPMVFAIDRAAYNQGVNAKFDIGIDENGPAYTVVAKGPGAVAFWNGTQTCSTLTANNAGGNQRMPDKENFNCAIQNGVVRRLTPLECERLQGYPDGWTDIGDWTDSKGKAHKCTDSARYKALGNSISLPNWFYVLQKLSISCGSDVTMASLFDGIGGFPLLWETLNGKGSCLWASEIEEFPIAVTKLRFKKDNA